MAPRSKLHRMLVFTLGVMGITMMLFGLKVSRMPQETTPRASANAPPLANHPAINSQADASSRFRSADLSSNSNSRMMRKSVDNGYSAGQKKKVAFAITVTKDGPYLDGAAVLKQSVINTKPTIPYDFVAIVHPGVTETRAGLIALGFRIKEFDPPILAKEIRGEKLRETIDQVCIYVSVYQCAFHFMHACLWSMCLTLCI
jgi:hypothetical protein